MGVLKTKVQIGGITIKDDSGTDPKLLISWEYERTIERGISEMVMTVLRDTNDTVSLAIGKSVSVWTGFTTSTDQKEFEGEIIDFDPEGGIIKIVCQDKMHELVKKNVNQVYLSSGAQAGKISAIAKDLIETFGGLTSDEEDTGTTTGRIIGEFRCTQTDIYERLMKLAEAVQYQLWHDPINDTVHFEPRGFNDSGLTLTVGTEILGVPKWENDSSKLVNDLRIDGAVSETQLVFPTTGNGLIGTTSGFETTGITLPKTPESVQLIFEDANPPTIVREGGGEDSSTTNFFFVDRENKIVKPADGTTFTATHRAIVNYTWLAPAPIHMVNQPSIDEFTSHEKQITLTDVITIADAETRAAEILSRFSQPFKKSTLLVKSDSTLTMKVGDTIRIVDALNKPNVDQEFVITKQLKKYPGSNQEITVGDEALRMADWQFNVEERLKRLEEKLSLKNQDLLQELRYFIQSMTIQPRYRKITTRDTSTDTIWGRDNWGGVNNWDGTYDNSVVNNFIQQFEDSYTEDFIDDDFEDTGTASWSTTGSVSFTSGQIALSSSIDFNNSTITTATLNSTEVSGSFTYELAADGSTFESVTPGTAHTFSTTGTDLRFKITENAASTGEISQVKITDYH